MDQSRREIGPAELTIGIVVVLVLAFIAFGLMTHSALYSKTGATSTPTPNQTNRIVPPPVSPPPAPSVSPKPSITPINGCFRTSSGNIVCANATSPN